MKEGTAYQGASITVSRKKKRLNEWKNKEVNTSQTLYVFRVHFYCTSTAATPCQIQVSPIQGKHVQSFFFFHSRGILKNMFVYKVMFSKLHKCHGILFKLLYSGIDVVMSKGCISVCVSRPQFKSGLEC